MAEKKYTYSYVKRIEQKFPCGCHIDEMIDGSYGLTYCPKHKVAPELYEALKRWQIFMKDNYTPDDLSFWYQTENALNKADGE